MSQRASSRAAAIARLRKSGTASAVALCRSSIAMRVDESRSARRATARVRPPASAFASRVRTRARARGARRARPIRATPCRPRKKPSKVRCSGGAIERVRFRRRGTGERRCSPERAGHDEARRGSARAGAAVRRFARAAGGGRSSRVHDVDSPVGVRVCLIAVRDRYVMVKGSGAAGQVDDEVPAPSSGIPTSAVPRW